MGQRSCVGGHGNRTGGDTEWETNDNNNHTKLTSNRSHLRLAQPTALLRDHSL
jgi:hypothetical protein